MYSDEFIFRFQRHKIVYAVQVVDLSQKENLHARRMKSSNFSSLRYFEKFTTLLTVNGVYYSNTSYYPYSDH